MFTVNDLSKRFGDTLLFEHVSFSINAGDRIGLVGPNGTGKTTLLRLITGEDRSDSGSLSIAPETAIGYLKQGFSDVPNGSFGDLLDIPTNGLISSHQELLAATTSLADSAADPVVANDTFERASAHFDSLGSYAALDELEALLGRFGLDGIDWGRPLSTLSGGQKTRAGLAALLSSRPDLLILDEPTNHLDSEALAWLSGFLDGYAGAVLVVSHDRGFLDDVVNQIFAIDALSRTLTAYGGSYSDFVATRRHEEDEAEAAWHRQQAEVTRIKRDIRAAETKARTIESSTIDYAVRKKAAKIARPAVVRKKKLERMLDSADAAEKPERRWGMALDFGENAEGARNVVQLDGVSISLGGQEILRDVDLLIRHGERVALLGPNGSGKTTLMRVITGEITPDQGNVRIGSGVRTGYFAQEQQSLESNLTVLEQANRVAVMSESELRGFLHRFLFGGESVHRRVGDLSYGERARLMLALLVLKETTLLLLDEPLNHLDIEAREEFEQALSQFSGTTLMVLHDRYAIERIASRCVALQAGHLTDVTMEVAP